MFAWGAGCCLMLLRLVNHCRRVVQLRRASRPFQNERLQNLLCEVARQLGSREALLLVSDRTVTPWLSDLAPP
jgi:hypothetical protein